MAGSKWASVGLVRKWGANTKAEDRTVEALEAHLSAIQISKRDLIHQVLYLAGNHWEGELWRKRLLANLLTSLGISFQMTCMTADAILRPRTMYDSERYGYEFFLHSYEEHDWLKVLVRMSAEGTLRLQVRPVFPADGDLAAWLFDPWGERVYQFCKRSPSTGGVPGEIVRKSGVVTSSTGQRSVCKIYDGSDHPFLRVWENVVVAKNNARVSEQESRPQWWKFA